MSEIQGNLFSTDAYGNPTPPCVRTSATSVAAAKAQTPEKLTADRAIVLAFIREHGGATDQEGIAADLVDVNAWRARRGELVKAGLVRDSGRTRKTVSGRLAVVWEATR